MVNVFFILDGEWLWGGRRHCNLLCNLTNVTLTLCVYACECCARHVYIGGAPQGANRSIAFIHKFILCLHDGIVATTPLKICATTERFQIYKSPSLLRERDDNVDLACNLTARPLHIALCFVLDHSLCLSVYAILFVIGVIC